MRPSYLVMALPLGTMGANPSASCYCMPGDPCWPSADAWSQFNDTLSGRLIATVPIGSPCHNPNYDADACNALQAEWTLPVPQ